MYNYYEKKNVKPIVLKYVETRKEKHVYSIRSIDIISFLILASIINLNAINLFLPSIDAVMTVIGFFFLCLYYLVLKKRLDGCTIMWGIYMIWLCVSNLLNSQSLFISIFYPMKVVTFILINKVYLDKHDKTLLRITRHYLTIIILINYLIQIIDQDMFGYTHAQNYVNFFESDNYLGWYYVPYIALCVILDFIEQGKIRSITILEISICVASIVRAWSGKTLVALALIALYILFVYRRQIAKFFVPKLLGIGYVIIDVGIVFLGVQNLVSSSLYDLLGKDITLSGRTILWLSVIQNIKKSPIFGHGITKGGELFINQGIGRSLAPAHNIFLEVAVQSGLIGLSIYIVMLIVAFSKAHRTYAKSIQCQNYQYEYLFLIFIIFIMFFMAILSHPVYIPFFYFPIILLTSFDSLVDMHDKTQNQGSVSKR